MVDLRTRWLGLDLAHPLLTDVEEDAKNAAAVVAEPGRVACLKKALRVPVIVSLRGDAAPERAPRAEKAGADGIELDLPSESDPWDPPQAIERRAIGLVRAVRARTRLPLAVKLPPFFTSLPHMAREVEEAGADGIVLFSPFLASDVDLDRRQARSTSSPPDFLLRLHHTASLYGLLRTPIGVSGGARTAVDVLKALSRGAQTLVVRGDLRALREEISAWLDRHEIPSVEAYRGSLDRRPAI